MPKIIAIDFGGTLCENIYPDIGRPFMDVIEKAKSEKTAGAKLILWTCREGRQLQEALDWCASLGLYFDAVNDNLPETLEAFGFNPRKVAASEYWDDRSAAYDTPTCERCKLRRETTKTKHRVYPWCANTCKNYAPKEDK